MNTTGQDFVKKIKPIGCAMFLGLAVIVTVICFTAKGVPLPGYEAPNTSDYYEEHIEELAAELAENLIPLTEYEASVEAAGQQVIITGTESDINSLRPYILHYYDVKLFEFKYR